VQTVFPVQQGNSRCPRRKRKKWQESRQNKQDGSVSCGQPSGPAMGMHKRMDGIPGPNSQSKRCAGLRITMGERCRSGFTRDALRCSRAARGSFIWKKSLGKTSKHGDLSFFSTT
jgi:hypothetical protein